MMHYPFWPVTVFAFISAVAWVFSRLKQNVQPLRLELADKGEAVLRCPDSSENAKYLARLYLDSSFSFRGHLLIGNFIVPGVAAIYFFTELMKKGMSAEGRRETNPEIQELVDDISDLHMRITAANHPILCGTLLFSMLFWFSIATVLIVLIRGVIPPRMPAEKITERIDNAYARIPIRLRGHAAAAPFGS